MPHLASIRWLLFLLAAIPDGQATSETIPESRRRILDAHAAKAKRIGALDAPLGLPIAFECVPRPEQFNAGFDLEKRQAIVPLPPGIGLSAPSLRPLPQRFPVGSDSSLSPVVTLMTEPLLARISLADSATSPYAFGSSYSQDISSQHSSLQIASSSPESRSSTLLLSDPGVSSSTLTVSSQLPLEIPSQVETLATGTTTTLTEETIAPPSLLTLPPFLLSERPTASDSTAASNPSITPFPFPSSASYCGETIFVSDIEAYRTQSASDYSGSELPWFLAPHTGLLWLVDPGYNWLVHNTPLSNTNITYSYSATIINANYVSANQTFLSPVFVEASTTFAEQACIIGARNCGYSSIFNPPRTANYIATGSLAPTQTISCGEIKTITIGDRSFPTANFLDDRSCIVGAELLYDYFRVDHRDERYFVGDRVDSAPMLATNLQASFYQSSSGCNVTKTFFNTLILTNCPPSAGGGFNSPLIDPRAIKTQIFDAPTIQLQQVAPTPFPAPDGASNGASGSGDAPALVPRPAPITDPLPAATALPVLSSNKGGSVDSVKDPSGSGSGGDGGSSSSGSPNNSPGGSSSGGSSSGGSSSGGSSSGGSGSAAGGSEPVANPGAPVANSGNSGGTGGSNPSSGNGNTSGTGSLPGNGANTGAAAVGNGVGKPSGGSAPGSGTSGGGQAVVNDNLSGSGNTNENTNSVAQGGSSDGAPVMTAGARGGSERVNEQTSGASDNNGAAAGQQDFSMGTPSDIIRTSNQVNGAPAQALPPIGAVPLGSNLASSAGAAANRAIQALAAAGVIPSSDLQRVVSNDAAGAASALRAASSQLATIAATATGTALSSIRAAQSSVVSALSGIASVVATASVSAARITTNAQGSRVTVTGLVAATALTIRTATTTDASGAVTTVLVTGSVDGAGGFDPLADNAVRAASSTSRAGASGHHGAGGSHLAAALASIFFSCIGLLL